MCIRDRCYSELSGKIVGRERYYYQIGKELKRKYYGINMNSEEAPEGYYGDEFNYEGRY